MSGAEMMMADAAVGVILAVAFAIVAMVGAAMFEPKPLEYL